MSIKSFYKRDRAAHEVDSYVKEKTSQEKVRHVGCDMPRVSSDHFNCINNVHQLRLKSAYMQREAFSSANKEIVSCVFLQSQSLFLLYELEVSS